MGADATIYLGKQGDGGPHDTPEVVWVDKGDGLSMAIIRVVLDVAAGDLTAPEPWSREKDDFVKYIAKCAQRKAAQLYGEHGNLGEHVVGGEIVVELEIYRRDPDGELPF